VQDCYKRPTHGGYPDSNKSVLAIKAAEWKLEQAKECEDTWSVSILKEDLQILIDLAKKASK
jgi:hypothetical protein